MEKPQWWTLPDNRRRFVHGPIDLTLSAEGDPHHVTIAHDAAIAFSQTMLSDIASELPLLRAVLASGSTIAGACPPAARGHIAKRMVQAAWPHRGRNVTPMAAVAGSVADALLHAMCDAATLRRAYVNDGGDIALHLAPRETTTVGVVGELNRPTIHGSVTITAESAVRGVATSGTDGRSLSLGIADAVCVLARTGAAADVAATLIANAVNTESPRVERAPAETLVPDTDLVGRLVTVNVGALDQREIDDALNAGAAVAERMRRDGLIAASFLMLRGNHRVVGDMTNPHIATTPDSRAFIEGHLHP